MLRPHTGTVDIEVENRSEKKVRYFMSVLFFIQTFTTTMPFIRETVVEEDGVERISGEISALQFVVQDDGLAHNFGLAMIGLPLIILPIVAFFFCIFDKRSRVKYAVTGLTSVICAVIISFSVGKLIHYGAVFTLFINIATLFMTSQGFQYTTKRMLGDNHQLK